MNKPLTSLFEECANKPGILGCGVQLPDRAQLVRSCHRDCTEESLKQALQQLTNTAALLTSHNLAPHRLVWTFAGGTLYIALCPNGTLFTLAANSHADITDFFELITVRISALTN
jgi:hypothetical protein